jgi:hypothetical protein
VGFYKPTPSCQPIKTDTASNPLSHSVEDVNGCLNTDQTIIKTTNLKGEVQLAKGNKLSLYSLFSAKQRNARNASDLTPIESTVRQDAVPSSYGTSYWVTGPNQPLPVSRSVGGGDRLRSTFNTRIRRNFISTTTIRPTRPQRRRRACSASSRRSSSRRSSTAARRRTTRSR